MAGLRAVERAERSGDGRHRDDGADDRVPAPRRRRLRPRRPPSGHARRRPRPRARGRRARGPVDHGGPRALARRRARRAVRRRRRVLRARVRRDRARRPAGLRARAGQLARPVRAPDRPAPRRPGARRGAHLRDRRRPGLRLRRRLVRDLGARAAVDAHARAAARRRAAVGRRRHTHPPALRPPPRVAVGGVRSGRGRVCLWATFATAAVAYLLFMGPAEVLLPFIVKNTMHEGADDLGLVFAAGGLGSIASAIAIGQRGLPRRDITFMYAAWTLATIAVAGYGLSSAIWQLMLASFAFNALETAGTIVWAT